MAEEEGKAMSKNKGRRRGGDGGGNKTGRGWKVEKVEKEPEPETGPLT